MTMPRKFTGCRPGRPATAPWAILIRELVEEGPVEYLSVVESAAALIPPGRGYRVGVAHADAPEQRARERKDAYIGAGAREMARQTIRWMVKFGRVERYAEDGVQMLRLGSNPWPKQDEAL